MDNNTVHTEAREWLNNLMGEHHLSLPIPVYNELVAKLGGMPADEWLNKMREAIWMSAASNADERRIMDVARSRILPAASEAGAVPVAASSIIEKIAQQWDGCEYDGVGGAINIGNAIRSAGSRLMRETRLAPAAQPEKQAAQAAWHFDRYIDGELMAEGVVIERQKDMEGAMRAAAAIASKGPNGEVPILVLRAAPPAPSQQAPAAEPVRTDAQIVAQTEELARLLMLEVYSREAPADMLFRDAEDPRGRHVWQLACKAQEILTATDPENAVAALDDAAPAAESVYPQPCTDLRYHDEFRRGWNACLTEATGSDPAAESTEPVTMKEICPECGHQFDCFHNPYINQLRAVQPTAATADAQATKPAKRPYNASGSLSEYGVFPMCDVPTETADAQGDERAADIQAIDEAIDHYGAACVYQCMYGCGGEQIGDELRAMNEARRRKSAAIALVCKALSRQPSAAARPSHEYAGVRVWVGDSQATAVATRAELERTSCDVMLHSFERARAALAAAKPEGGSNG
ncbi:hypothetical protein ACL598_17750 [Bordetella bronchialis]|uniref:hypothetical protein n=1 Tax=Bordetella bronchialis TaxID=463025 RepID=UPI003CFDB25A